jgi:hypothetical protein
VPHVASARRHEICARMNRKQALDDPDRIMSLSFLAWPSQIHTSPPPISPIKWRYSGPYAYLRSASGRLRQTNLTRSYLARPNVRCGALSHGLPRTPTFLWRVRVPGGKTHINHSFARVFAAQCTESISRCIRLVTSMALPRLVS